MNKLAHGQQKAIYDSYKSQIESLKKQNEIMRSALEELVHHCNEYGLSEESLTILISVEKAREALLKSEKDK
jgi:hypothetical protein